MASFLSRFASSAAVAAALSMAATPAFASPLPQVGGADRQTFHGPTSWSIDRETAHHGWGGRGWHHRDGVSAGDVLAGVLLIGGIAAIASAASKSNNDKNYRDDYPDRDSYPERSQNYDSRPSDGYRSGGMDNAVNMCVNEIERGQDRVANVDNAARNGDGWSVSGQLEAGGGFTCSIDNDGRLRGIQFGDSDYRGSATDSGSAMGYQDDDRGTAPDNSGQWNDDDYARARAQAGSPSPDNYSPSDDNNGG